MKQNFQFSFFSFQFNKWLVLICLLFLATRLYQIDSNPPSLSWDEASIGYNAYSVLTTGKDEWGKTLPLHFRAFGEFKLPVYIYTVAGFESIFGMSELAVRLPAVFYSLGCLLLVYALTKLISKRQSTALLAALFFATAPWFFIFSRTGHEMTAGLFFYLLGIWIFFQNGLKTSRFLLLASCLILTMYSYNSFRIIAPLTLVILVGYLISQNRHHLRAVFKPALIALIIFLIGFLPILRFVYTGGNTRFEQVSIFKDNPNFIQAIGTFGQNYVLHFSPQFLVLPQTESTRNLVPGFGELNPLMFLLIFAGFWWIYKQKSKIGLIFLLLIMIAPIPASLTFEAPHALRTSSILPFLAIIAAIGIEKLTSKKWLPILVSLMVVGFFGWYFYQFITTYPKTKPDEWQYSYKIINTKYAQEISDAREVYISPALAQPYIFTLFYQKYDSEKFRREVEYNPPDQWGMSLVRSIGKIDYYEPANLEQLPEHTLIFVPSRDTIDPSQMSNNEAQFKVYSK